MKSKRLTELRKALQDLTDADKAAGFIRFFKTGPGEYGYGDKFYGISVPDQRKVLKKYVDLTFAEIQDLLASKYHEERFIGLQILVHQFQKGDAAVKTGIYDFYTHHTEFVNNWDLVDSSAPQIPGAYLMDKPRNLLFDFARSTDLWQKRISILATFTFIRNKDYSTTLEISKILLKDDHDLIHKAVGWMLREVANRNLSIALKFLNEYAGEMPRTMLRYAIEKFPGESRKKYLAQKKRDNHKADT